MRKCPQKMQVKKKIITKKKDDLVNFFPSDKWTGEKKGYVFKVGKRGLGYYLDVGLPLPTKAKTTINSKTSYMLPDYPYLILSFLPILICIIAIVVIILAVKLANKYPGHLPKGVSKILFL